jgi:hypothetical protein
VTVSAHTDDIALYFVHCSVFVELCSVVLVALRLVVALGYATLTRVDCKVEFHVYFAWCNQVPVLVDDTPIVLLPFDRCQVQHCEVS